MPTALYRQFVISPGESGRSVRSFLLQEMGLSGRALRSVKFSEDGILVNGERVTVRRVLQTGDRLSVRISDPPERQEHLQPTPMKLDIIYEDEELLVINKPAGLVCHPSGGHYADSLANGVRAHLDQTAPAARIHLLGRLDKDTSGLVCIAKNRILAQHFQEGGSGYKIEKIYLALVAGHVPRQGQLCQPALEQRDSRGILRLVPADKGCGKEAVTDYRILWEGRDFSLARVRIQTGRMHQIRFHFAGLGHPLLGDSLYGSGPIPGLARSGLHAACLKIYRPESGSPLPLSAPLPADMRELLLQGGFSGDLPL